MGVFADSRLQPRWLVDGLKRAGASGAALIAAVGIGGAARRAEPARAGLYGRLDEWAFGAGPRELVDLPASVPHEVMIEGGEGDAAWSAAALAALRLDVAFAVGGFDDRLLDGIASCGVWRYAFDGLGEVAAGEPLTGARIVARLAAGGPSRIACESWSRTYPLSAARNRAELLHKASEFPARALRDAQRSGRTWLEQCRVYREPAAVSRESGNGSTAILRIGTRIARRAVQKALSVDQWFLAFKLGNGAPDAGLDASLEGFTRLLPPRDRDWADPFALEKGGRHYVFFEELPRAAGKGHIAMLEIDAQGGCSQPARVLERDYHLSYPCVFEHEGALYMIPETAQNGTVELYRCTDFPSGWKLEARLLSGVRLVDATVHRGADRWWLFANAAAGGSRVFDDELHLFHAPALLGPWEPHRRNPVKSDARGARPAGRLFWRNGTLHRPAQICVPRFGAGIALQRVLRLTPQDYFERQVERILPADPGLLGLHTVNRAGHLTVVDGFTRRRRI